MRIAHWPPVSVTGAFYRPAPMLARKAATDL